MTNRFDWVKARKRRFALGLTLTEVAAEIGAPKSYLSQIERGEFQPGPERFKDLARVLRIDPDELWVTDDPAAPQT